MTITQKDIRSSFTKIRSYLDQLLANIEERQRLIDVLKLTPSLDDNLDLINLLAKIKKSFQYLHLDISAGHIDAFADQFSTLIDSYKSSLDVLSKDAYIDAHEYEYTDKIVKPEAPELNTKKLVRFKDYDADEEDNMRSQLMGTSTTIKPYRDDPDQQLDSDALSLQSVDTSNREMFAQHQQQLLEQDQHLDALHDSIRTQHLMGRNINLELDEHLILLNDLERGVDDSGSRLGRASGRLKDFRTKVSENGSLVTIIVLSVILILLLVVLS
uniref:t-SNARE coiled-coil homology domain-containing protein n=1 Tax=Candidozyma auris TaxID=498019 RepID=A0A0L0P1W6_CANAR